MQITLNTHIHTYSYAVHLIHALKHQFLSIKGSKSRIWHHFKASKEKCRFCQVHNPPQIALLDCPSTHSNDRIQLCTSREQDILVFPSIINSWESVRALSLSSLSYGGLLLRASVLTRGCLLTHVRAHDYCCACSVRARPAPSLLKGKNRQFLEREEGQVVWENSIKA